MMKWDKSKIQWTAENILRKNEYLLNISRTEILNKISNLRQNVGWYSTPGLSQWDVCIPDISKGTKESYAFTQASGVNTDWRSSTLPTVGTMD